MASSSRYENGPGPKYLYWAARHPPLDPKPSFKGKTVLVTGANTGLGYCAAVKYAVLGASHLILAVRSPEKGEAAKASIIHETECPSQNIDVMVVDFASFSSVQAFAEKLNARVSRLDIVLLCAGVTKPTFTTGQHGLEVALQVNVLSTALLAILLLPKLRETDATSGSSSPSPPHLCFVNSIGHHQVEAGWMAPGQSLIQRINDPSGFDASKQYSLVKLAAWFAMQGVIESCKGDGAQIVINSACPGLCKTDLGRDFPLVARVLTVPFQAVFARTAEEGSRTLVSATTLGLESTGKMWTNDEFPPPSKLVASDRGEELCRETWEEILVILRKYANI